MKPSPYSIVADSSTRNMCIRRWIRRRSLSGTKTAPFNKGQGPLPMRTILLLIMVWCCCFYSTKTMVQALEQQPQSSPVVRKMMNNSPWRNGLKNGLASAGAAACVKILLQPIDAIKTVQQYETQNVSVLTAFRQLYQRGQLYAGLGVTVIGSMPSVALYFGVYSYCKQRFLQTKFGKDHSTASIALSAAIGNSVASFSRVPYETIKQKLQAGLYKTTWAVLVDLKQRGPVLAQELLFPAGGVWVQMLRDIPYAVVTLLLYESLQQRFHHPKVLGVDNNNMANPTKNQKTDFILGGIAGGIGSWVTNPMDVVKTRIQTGTADSVWSCAVAVWKEGGIHALFRGSIPRLLHKVPANACFFLFYETFKRLLNVQSGGATGTKINVASSELSNQSTTSSITR